MAQSPARPTPPLYLTLLVSVQLEAQIVLSLLRGWGLAGGRRSWERAPTGFAHQLGLKVERVLSFSDLLGAMCQ